MILLITSSSRSSELQRELQHGVGESVETARDSASAVRRLRAQEFEAVVFDECGIGSQQVTELFCHLATATPILINTALASCPRILLEVKSALRRRAAERVAARRAAGRELREDLRNALTGILLSSELAINCPDPTGARKRIQQVVALAERMRHVLEIRS